MAWMSDGIRMATHTGGGLWAGIKRTLGGGGLFITEFTADTDGHIAFAPRFPGTIMPVTLKAGESLVCRKETFLCAEKTVTLDIAMQQRLGAGFFAGQGFILQKVIGPGTVWLDLSGEVVSRDLKPGERFTFMPVISACRRQRSVSISRWCAALAICCSAARDYSLQP